MDSEPDSFTHNSIFLQASPFLFLFSVELTGAALFVIFLLVCSALISGSEVAYFSLSSNDYESLRQEKSKSGDRILGLKEKPRSLLANILIANNFINIAIVIVSEYIIRQTLSEELLERWGSSALNTLNIEHLLSAALAGRIFNFIITIVGVTFLLVLFGEVIPKVYARINNIKLAKMMSLPIIVLDKLFRPLSSLLVNGTGAIENRLAKNSQGLSVASKKDFDQAIELTVAGGKNAKQEVDLLKSIVNFGEVSVKQIMRSRVDVIGLDVEQSFPEVLKIIRQSGYSRIPVYKEDFDHVSGILYVKDLIGSLSEGNDFQWQQFIRTEILFAPEQKKISELLKDFQSSRMHMAIIVDEYGGSSGIVTLEDIMEEVVGDIRDEFDNKLEIDYKKLDDFNYVFEGKSMLNDVCRILGLETDAFDEIKGESDSLAGMILEMSGFIPKKGREASYKNYKFKVLSSDKRRIKEVQVTLPKP